MLNVAYTVYSISLLQLDTRMWSKGTTYCEVSSRFCPPGAAQKTIVWTLTFPAQKMLRFEFIFLAWRKVPHTFPAEVSSFVPKENFPLLTQRKDHSYPEKST
jgi:hypothetical protein